MLERQNKKILDEDGVRKLVKDMMASGIFTVRKTSDNPIDSNGLVPRKFVTMNGTTTSRPTTSILGQYYFDTTINRPIWWNGTGWIKADGTSA